MNIIAGSASSGVALAVAEQAAQNKVLFVSGPAAADAITGINEYTFRSGRQTAQDVATAGTFLDDLEGKTITVFAQNSAFGQGNEAAVKAILGEQGATVNSVLVAEDVTEFTPFAQQVLAGNPDLVFVAWAGATVGRDVAGDEPAGRARRDPGRDRPRRLARPSAPTARHPRRSAS